MSGHHLVGSEADDRLLRALAEHMKLPLLQVARQAELAHLSREPLTSLASIELTAETALRLIDNYLLSTKLSLMRADLQLEPVSVAAVLTETAHKLSKLAARYQCELEVHISGRYEPVMAHPAGLAAAMESLGYVLLEAQAARDDQVPRIIKLAAHRGKNGIVAGLFTSSDGVGSDMYRRAQQLYGRARQALPELTTDSGAGVFVADSLLDTMSSRLRVAHHQKLSGLAATLMPSQQLQLV